MLQARTRWRCADISGALAAQLAQQADISLLLAKLLIIRGIDDKAKVDHFLNDSLDELLDPYDLAGMREAVARIQEALRAEERIWIYGDYDADGVSSTSLMIYLMRELHANYDYYIPHRALEGYGLNNEAIDQAKTDGVKLIITVDTGISAVEQIAYAKSLGIDVVVTDHHEPPEVLPQAVALVNPKLPYCSYPFKGLAGVGVAFKLAHALLGTVPVHLLELAAIGTVADLMPLTGENRIIVREAIVRMRRSAYVGIHALLQVSGVDASQVTSTTIAFSMAPRINASGRLDHANTAVQLLTTNDPTTALACAEELDRLNKTRQQIVEQIVKEAEAQLAMKLDAEGNPPHVIVLAQSGWNVGVIGIVASKILERYYRPTFILGIDEETGLCKGSARSIEGFDLHASMSSCAHLFEHYGGHQAAAGMTIARERLNDLEQEMNAMAIRVLKDDDLVPYSLVDAECTLADIPLHVIDELSCLEPFGMGNSSPKVILKDMIVNEKRTMGKENQHLKLSLKQEHATLDAVAFGKGMLMERIAESAYVDVLGELHVNEWNGRRKPQLMLQDIRIRAFQVFDRRGANNPIVQAVELARKLNQDRPDEACWLTTREMAGVYAAETFVQLLDDHISDRDTVFTIKDLIVTEVPDHMAAVRRMSLMYPNLERLHLVLPSSPVKGRIYKPERARMIPVFAAMKQLGTWKCDSSTIESLALRLGFGMKEFELLLKLFEDLQFVQIVKREHEDWYQMTTSPRKVSLESSSIFQEWLEASEWETLWYDCSTKEIAKLFE